MLQLLNNRGKSKRCQIKMPRPPIQELTEHDIPYTTSESIKKGGKKDYKTKLLAAGTVVPEEDHERDTNGPSDTFFRDRLRSDISSQPKITNWFIVHKKTDKRQN